MVQCSHDIFCKASNIADPHKKKIKKNQHVLYWDPSVRSSHATPMCMRGGGTKLTLQSSVWQSGQQPLLLLIVTWLVRIVSGSIVTLHCPLSLADHWSVKCSALTRCSPNRCSLSNLWCLMAAEGDSAAGGARRAPGSDAASCVYNYRWLFAKSRVLRSFLLCQLLVARLSCRVDDPEWSAAFMCLNILQEVSVRLTLS